jgi:hypothetical protein
MTLANTTITYVAASAGSLVTDWVKLSQIIPPEITQYASLKDVEKLWRIAATGGSAQRQRATDCPVEFDGENVIVYLGFYAWPSRPDLAFTLAAAIGEISGDQIINMPREISVFVDNRSTVDLDYWLENAVIEWETPAFDRYGAEIPRPTWTNHHTHIEFASEFFGCVRIKGTATGHHYTSTMTLAKPIVEEPITPNKPDPNHPENVIIIGGETPTTQLNGYKIENLQNTITATWLDNGETKTDQMQLVIPSCVKAILEMCPNMLETIVLLCHETSTLKVFWNTCTGQVMSAAPVNKRSYCNEISHTTGVVNPWGMGLLPPGAFA